jgi:diacylglycerol O-acyltransferase
MNSAALSPLEAGFLYAESPFTPMHIGSVSIYEGGEWRATDGKLRLDDLTEHIQSKLAAVPRLRQHPVWPLGRVARPRWVDDSSFDIGRHVNVVSVPSPGTESQLLALVEDLHMMLMDRSHPLWELWFIDGLDGGRVAVLEKIHHSLVDGIGGVDLAVMLLDTEPTPAATSDSGEAPPAGSSILDRFLPLVWAFEAAMEVPVNIGRDLAAIATHPLSAFSRGRQLGGAVLGLFGDVVAPRTSLNQQVGGRRKYRVIRRSLEDVRQTGHALGGSINDVVLTAVSAGLHDVVSSRKETFADIHALVPVSLRGDDQHSDLGNRVSALIVALPTRDLDPAERFAAVRSAVRNSREHNEVELSETALSGMDVLPEPLVASLALLTHHQPLFNLVVTNVPGPPMPLYLMGSKMLEVFPLVPLARNLTVSIGILSYNHQLALGLWSDADRFSDIDVLVDGIDDGFTALDKAAAEVPSSGS